MSFHRRLLLSALLVFLSCTPVWYNAVSANQPSLAPETLTSVNEARALFTQAFTSKGKERLAGLRQSFSKLQQAIETDDSLPPAQTMWAKMLIAAGDQKSALSSLQQSVVEASQDPEAYVILANLSVRSGQWAQAQLAYDAAQQRVENWPDGHWRKSGMQAQIASGLATVAQTQSALAAQNGSSELAITYEQSALKRLKQWVSAAPQNANAHNRLAIALLKQGQLEQAIKSFDQARTLNPTLPVTDLRLAQSFLASGDHEAAFSRAEKAIAANPDVLDVRIKASDLMLLLGKLDLAAKHLDLAQSQDADNLAVRRLQAQLLRFRGDWEQAAQQLQDLNTRYPSDFETANLLALTLSELSSGESRRQALSMATVTAQRFKPNTREGLRSRISLVWAAHQSGQSDAAKKALEQLLSLGIPANQISGDEAFYLARLLVEYGRPELAAPLLTSALARVGHFPKRDLAQALQAQLH